MATQDDSRETEEPTHDRDSRDDPDELSAEERRERRHRHREARQALREERHRLREERRSRRHGGGHHGRKERVLHTRVSEELSDDIRRLAQDLRVPASNLVRNVLEEVFSVVEEVSGDVGELLEDVVVEAEEARDRIARRMSARRQRVRRRRQGQSQRQPNGEHDRPGTSDDAIETELRRDEADEAARESAADPAPPRFDDVLGWQPLVLNRERTCARCGTGIPRGERAFIGLTEGGTSRTTLCQECTKAL